MTLLFPQIFYKKNCIVIILALFIIIIGCKENKSNADSDIGNPSDLKKLTIPIYPNAKSLNTFTMKSGKIKGIKYKANERYPAKSVLEFYETEMKKLNFVSFVEEYYAYNDRKWQRFVDGTKKGEPYVAQLTADWVDPSKSKRIKLILNYYWDNYDGSSKIVLTNNDKLIVTVQDMPFYTLPPPPGKKE